MTPSQADALINDESNILVRASKHLHMDHRTSRDSVPMDDLRAAHLIDNLIISSADGGAAYLKRYQS